MLVTTLVGGSLHAQVATAPLAPAPPPWFVYLRYGFHSPEYAFAAYSFGKPSIVAGIVADAESGYDEVLAGAGVNFYSAAGNGATLYAMGSMATDSWYLVLYALPNVTVRRLNVTSVAGWYVPLERLGTTQLFLDPITALWRLGPRLAVGGSYSVFAARSYPTETSAGPSVQLALPNGSLTVDAMRPIANTRAEIRTALQLVF